MARMTFPQDRTSFVYQGPNQPILTPPRTALEVFDDQGCVSRADIVNPDGTAIAYATVYTADDGLLPEFLGPPDGRLLLYARVVGSEGVYAIEARYADAIATLITADDGTRSLVPGHGPPATEDGVVDGFYLDLDASALWGPKASDDTWPEPPLYLGPPVLAPTTFDYEIVLPVQEVLLDHPLASPTPGVIYTNADNQQELCGVSYPSPSRVMATFGSPSTGRIHLYE